MYLFQLIKPLNAWGHEMWPHCLFSVLAMGAEVPRAERILRSAGVTYKVVTLSSRALARPLDVLVTCGGRGKELL